MKNVFGEVFNIQRFSIHDGPGIRTVVFLKGCNLRCRWCSNPESQNIKREMTYDKRLCRLCGRCVAVCPVDGISLGEVGINIDRELCTGCGKCAKACDFNALKSVSTSYTVEEIVEIVKKDRPFYIKSSGGVTFSGGEPFIQKDFLLSLINQLEKEGIKTAVETAGLVPYNTLHNSKTSLFLYDLKHIDEELHKRYTGESNTVILENLRKLIADNRDVIVRIPLIPGINMDEEILKRTGAFLRSIRAEEVNLLPYHTLGLSKYKMLDMEYQLNDTRTPDEKEIERALKTLASFGLHVGRS